MANANEHPPDSDGGELPRRFGKYELVEKIGAGGMAEIFKARLVGIEGFEKLLVVKKILPGFASSRSFVKMLIDEAKLSSMLQHPNIVQIYDLGEADGQYYIAMEFVHGRDLLKILSRCVKLKRRIPLKLTLFLLAEVCKGLAYAHAARDLRGEPLHIIHRDVSPSNIMVSYDGDVKIMDFGVARARTHQQAETRAGVLKGKLGYMSPEQVTGKEIDFRSDIFSLGTILYEAITLKRLFLGKNDLETLINIRDVRIERRLSKHKYIPNPIADTIRVALSRDPSERFPTALELHDAILDFMYDKGLRVRARDLGEFVQGIFEDEVAARISLPPVSEEDAAIERAAAEVDEAEDGEEAVGVGDGDSPPSGSQGAETTRTRRARLTNPLRERLDLAPVEDQGSDSVEDLALEEPAPISRPDADALPPDVAAGAREPEPEPAPEVAPDRRVPTEPGERPTVSTERGLTGEFEAPRGSGAFAATGSGAFKATGTGAGTGTFPSGGPSRTFPSESTSRSALRAFGITPIRDYGTGRFRVPTEVRRAHGRTSPGVDVTETSEVSADLPANISVRLGESTFRLRDSLGNVFGPVTFNNFINLIKARAVTESEMVSVDGGEWRSARSIPGIREIQRALFAPEAAKPLIDGEIDHMDIPHTLFRLWSGRSTGKLKFHYKTTRKEVYLLGGKPQHVASTLKGELLGSFLVARKLVTPEQLQTAIQRMTGTREKLGDALVNLGYLRHHELFDAFQQLHRRKFQQMFVWNMGRFEFFERVRPPRGVILLDLDMPRAIAEGVREFYGFEELTRWFKPRYGMRIVEVRRASGGVRVQHLRFNSAEARFFNQIQLGGVLADVIRAHAKTNRDALILFRVLFLLIQMDMVRLQG